MLFPRKIHFTGNQITWMHPQDGFPPLSLPDKLVPESCFTSNNTGSPSSAYTPSRGPPCPVLRFPTPLRWLVPASLWATHTNSGSNTQRREKNQITLPHQSTVPRTGPREATHCRKEKVRQQYAQAPDPRVATHCWEETCTHQTAGDRPVSF